MFLNIVLLYNGICKQNERWTQNSEASRALGRFPRAAKAAVELDRGAAAAEAGYGVRVMKMAHEGAGLKNDLIVGFPNGADPLRAFVEGPDACFR